MFRVLISFKQNDFFLIPALGVCVTKLCVTFSISICILMSCYSRFIQFCAWRRILPFLTDFCDLFSHVIMNFKLASVILETTKLRNSKQRLVGGGAYLWRSSNVSPRPQLVLELWTRDSCGTVSVCKMYHSWLITLGNKYIHALS